MTERTFSMSLQARTFEPSLFNSLFKPPFAVKEFNIDGDDSSDDDDGDSDDEDGQSRDNADDVDTLTFHERDLNIVEDGLSLRAVVSIPDVARGVVIFAHGANSDRFSPRNQFIARQMNAAGFATVCADLLTTEESGDRMNVFDIDLLASRITHVARWTSAHNRLRGLPVALFGSNTGAAAALKAAAQLGDRVQAVISRGGRPDLASDILQDVLAPTLLIVGSEDTPVVSMNEWVLPRITAVHELAIIQGADHLFEEEGALEQVADLSVSWLERFLKAAHDWKSHYVNAQQSYII
jgi:putative phosphoribosyl transferase